MTMSPAECKRVRDEAMRRNGKKCKTCRGTGRDGITRCGECAGTGFKARRSPAHTERRETSDPDADIRIRLQNIRLAAWLLDYRNAEDSQLIIQELK
jgi:hypothetical protein